ncbi:MAG: aminopeptidase [Peptococcaceae bacterium]|nr:aminopeptidase [Peptococcaceae bacterium]
MEKSMWQKYANLIVKVGLNLQQGQILVINSPLECAEFTRIVAETAYKEGAGDVVVSWNDDLFARIRFLHAPDSVFDKFPPWRKEFYMYYLKQGAAFFSINAEDPEIMKDVNPVRLAKQLKANNTALKEYREQLMADKNVWSLASVPIPAWAQKVFPDLPTEQAMEKLAEAILKAVRVNEEDPIAAWEEHKQNLKGRVEFLNNKRFKILHFKNSLGTDLKVELPEDHIWSGGSSFTPEGIEFIANMPTEEVYTLPKKTGVNGRVVSSMPLNYNGNLIEQFSLTFEDGKVTEYSAEKGLETLKTLLETDEGSRYLGEVALVPYNSPISQSKILFYNTLFDENASCHLALGKAYPTSIRNGEKLSAEELKKLGVNDSLVHEDFMIGTEDMEIIGRTFDGEEIAIFKQGNFAF